MKRGCEATRIQLRRIPTIGDPGRAHSNEHLGELLCPLLNSASNPYRRNLLRK
jgi:hypothetical protein